VPDSLLLTRSAMARKNVQRAELTVQERSEHIAEWSRLADQGRRTGASAQSRAVDLPPTIQELQAAGCESLRAIAAGLEERGIPAARWGKWSAVQASRLLEAARSPFGVANVGVA
jgi:hypothetical protein